MCNTHQLLKPCDLHPSMVSVEVVQHQLYCKPYHEDSYMSLARCSNSLHLLRRTDGREGRERDTARDDGGGAGLFFLLLLYFLFLFRFLSFYFRFLFLFLFSFFFPFIYLFIYLFIYFYFIFLFLFISF
jgi:hypothetical protein